MDNFTVTDEIELTDELLGAVFGATGGSFDSYDYNQVANNVQSNAAEADQLAATSAIGGSKFGGNAAASAANWSNIGQSNTNTQKLSYYWY